MKVRLRLHGLMLHNAMADQMELLMRLSPLDVEPMRIELSSFKLKTGCILQLALAVVADPPQCEGLETAAQKSASSAGGSWPNPSCS